MPTKKFKVQFKNRKELLEGPEGCDIKSHRHNLQVIFQCICWGSKEKHEELPTFLVWPVLS